MVPNSRTPVRGVPLCYNGGTLRAVWQDEAGLLQAQTKDIQRVGGGAGDIVHRGDIPRGDAFNRRAETLSYCAFRAWRRARHGQGQVPQPAAPAQTHHSAPQDASYDQLKSCLFHVSKPCTEPLCYVCQSTVGERYNLYLHHR